MELLFNKEAFTSNVSEFLLIEEIKRKTAKMNADNISRTKAYQNYHLRNKEFFWPFLASMVSRNAGWNMDDLQLTEYRMLIPCNSRRWIFYTYERANWLIFADAYPQLLLYEKSKQVGSPLFHLLKEFGVSSFMAEEWERFWQTRNRKRLDTALIINEQHVIQEPVLDQEEYKRKVFSTFPYWLQDHLHFSTVLFPTLEGDLFGISVHGFHKVSNRIKLGKGLLEILTKPGLNERFIQFARMTEHTGSRADFERYLFQKSRKGHHLPLRLLYPIIEHQRKEYKDWSTNTRNVEKHFKKAELPGQVKLNDWYEHKRIELHVLARWKSIFKTKLNK